MPCLPPLAWTRFGTVLPFVQFRVEAPGRAGVTAVPLSYCSAEFGSGATERKPPPAVLVTVVFST